MYIEPLWAKSSNLIPSLPNFPHPLYSNLKHSPFSEKKSKHQFEVFVAESQEKEKEVKQRGGGDKRWRRREGEEEPKWGR